MAVFFEDTFTDTDGTSLTSHTPDTGTGWTVANGTVWKIDNNRAASDGDFDHILADDLPDSADYDVQADYVVIGSLTGFAPGISGRSAGNTNNVRVRSLSNGFELLQVTGGTHQSLATWTGHTWVVGTPVTVKLELRGTTAKVYVDGVERISETTNRTDRDQAGMLADGNGTNNADGVKLDNFSVSNPPAGPNPPSGVTTLRLSWTDTNAGTASHRIYFRTTAGPGAWTLALTVDPGVVTTPVPMDNSTPRVEHDYAVAAVIGGSESNLVLVENAQARVTHTPLTES